MHTSLFSYPLVTESLTSVTVEDSVVLVSLSLLQLQTATPSTFSHPFPSMIIDTNLINIKIKFTQY